MSRQRKIFGRLPMYKGDWAEGVVVKEKFRFTYRGSEFQALRDGLTIAPLDANDNVNDGWKVISNGTAAYRADARLTELDSEIDVLNAVDGITRVMVEAEIMSENVAIRWEDSVIWSYPKYNRTKSVTLNKGEAILIKANVSKQMAALYKTQTAGGFGTITSLVQGKENGIQTYAYLADNDNTYIGATYKAADGIEIYKITSDSFEQLSTGIEDNSIEIDAIKSLYEVAPMPLTIGYGTGNSGKPFESSVRATTGVLKNDKPLVVYVPKGFKAQYRSGDAVTDLPNSAYFKEDFEEGVYTLSYDGAYITFNLVANEDISADATINFIVARENTAIARLVRNYKDNADNLNAFKNQTMQPSISENLLNPYECVDNKALIDSTGNLYNNSDIWVTGYIEVNSSICSQVLISHRYCHRLAQYDENKNFIKITSANISPFTLNEATRYIRISYFKSGKDGGIIIPYENRFDVRVYYNLGYDVDDNHNILDKVNVRDSQYVDMQTIYPFLTDKENMAATSSFELLVFRGNQARKNQIFSSCAKYEGEGYATIQFMYSYLGSNSYLSPKYIIGGKGIYERKEWRVPPFLERVSELNVTIIIPDGGKLYFADFYNEYSNAVTPNVKNGILMNAHAGFGYAPGNTQGAFAMCAKLGFPQIVTMPKLTSDGVWVCFHDDNNIGNMLCNEDGTSLDAETAAKAISDITFEQLSRMIYKRGHSGMYKPPYKVPTLESFFDLCKKTGVNPMYSIHPLWGSSECRNNYDFCKKQGVLHLLTPKMPIAESYFDYFRTLYSVFGNDVKAYALNIDTTTVDSIISLVKNMNIEVPVTLELMANDITEEAVKKIVDNGFRASVAPYTGVEITGEMIKTWIKWGVTEFTEDHNCSFGLNW